MSLFFITFFSIYSGVHLYAFLKARAALSFSAKTSIFISLLMAIMIFAPLIVRFSEKLGLEFFARLMAYVGYLWMGILFLFFSSAVAVDIYRLLTYFIEVISRKDIQNLRPSAALSFYLPFFLSIIIALYGYFEAKDIRTERLVVKTSKIPKELGRLRIAQISDVHLGLIVRDGRLKRILEKVKEANPDIMVSTGDLVDGQINNLAGLAELFHEINPKYGKLAITGNHEFYAGVDQALAFTERAGFRIMRGEGLTIAGINIVGIDDPAGRAYGLFKDVSEKKLLSHFLREKFTLLLKHRPDVDNDASKFFDLQLSGHVHKGQIFPFSIITRLYYRHTTDAGHLKLMGGGYLYVSKGAGTWGPPIRFLAPPEVTVIDIIYDEGY